jgi:hypothetical protein
MPASTLLPWEAAGVASLARILGSLCLILAAAVVGLGVYVFVQGRTVETDSEELDSITEGAGAFYLGASLTSALMLATLGATAIVAAKASRQAAAASRAADRLARDHRPPPPAMAPPPPVRPAGPLPSPAAPPVAYPVAPLPTPAQTVPPPTAPQPPSQPNGPPDLKQWGPPAGPPVA